MVLGVLAKAGSIVLPREMFYKSLLQEVLLYGSYIWFITDPMMKVLEGYHHCIARNIVGNMAL